MFVDNYVRGPAVDSNVETGPRSIAVLPFENRSAREDDRFFVDGIHDELLTHLAQIASLDKVISRTSVMEYRDTARNLREIGESLGVTTILEGGVQRAGDRVRVNVQLIDAATDNHIWAEFYDRELSAENVFEIQTEVALAIAEALDAALTPEEAVRLSAVPTRSTRAYDFYLSGKDYLRRPGPSGTPLAVQQFERAVEDDPEFAEAWVQLARAHTFTFWYAQDQSDGRLELAMQAIEQARTLKPDLPDVHLALAQYRFMAEGDYAGALAEVDLVDDMLPDSAEVLAQKAYIQRRMGAFDDSVENMAGAIELDPRNLDFILNQAGTYFVLRQYVQAEAMVDRALEISPDSLVARVRKIEIALYRGDDPSIVQAALDDLPASNSPFLRQFSWLAAIMLRDYSRAQIALDGWNFETLDNSLFYTPKAAFQAWTHLLAGREDLARQSFETSHAVLEAARTEAPDDFRILLSLGEALAALDEPEEAVRLAQRALELHPPESDTQSAHVLQTEAVLRVFIPAGDYDAAFAELERYFSVPGRWSIEGLARDPRLDPIRADPRFVALLERYRRQ